MTSDHDYSANIHRRVGGIVLVKTGACRPGEAYCHPAAYDFLAAMVDDHQRLTSEVERLKAVVEAASSVLSEDGMREKVSCYVMGVELIERLDALSRKEMTT